MHTKITKLRNVASWGSVAVPCAIVQKQYSHYWLLKFLKSLQPFVPCRWSSSSANGLPFLPHPGRTQRVCTFLAELKHTKCAGKNMWFWFVRLRQSDSSLAPTGVEPMTSGSWKKKNNKKTLHAPEMLILTTQPPRMPLKNSYIYLLLYDFVFSSAEGVYWREVNYCSVPRVANAVTKITKVKHKLKASWYFTKYSHIRVQVHLLINVTW